MSKNSNASFKVAQTFAKQGDIDQAITEYEKLIQVEPQNLQICYELVELYARRGLISKVTDQYLKIADIYLGDTSLEQGIDICYKIIRLDPESIKAREKLIEIYNHMDNKDDVREQCFALSRICSMQGQSEKALEFLQKGIEVDPDNLDARLELAIMNVKQGHIKEGIAQYKEVAMAFWEKGELLKASETYKRVTVLQPDDTETHLNLGTLYRELGQLEDAKNAFRFILRYDLTHIKALTELGLVCQEKGEIDSAILAFRKIVDINPMKTEAREKLGELYLIRGQVQEAVKEYFAAAEDYLKQEMKPNAIQMCEIVLDLDCKHAKALRMIKELGYSSPPPAVERETPVQPPMAGMRDGAMPGRGLRRPMSGIMNIPRGDGSPMTKPLGPKRGGPAPVPTRMPQMQTQQGTARLSLSNTMLPGPGMHPVRSTKPLTPYKTMLNEEDAQKMRSNIKEEIQPPFDSAFSPPDAPAMYQEEVTPDSMEGEERKSPLISFSERDEEANRPSLMAPLEEIRPDQMLKPRIIPKRGDYSAPTSRSLISTKTGSGRLVEPQSEDTGRMQPVEAQAKPAFREEQKPFPDSGTERQQKMEQSSSISQGISIGEIVDDRDTALLAFDPDGEGITLTFEEEDTEQKPSAEQTEEIKIEIAPAIEEPPLVDISRQEEVTSVSDIAVVDFRPVEDDEEEKEEVMKDVQEHETPDAMVVDFRPEESGTDHEEQKEVYEEKTVPEKPSMPKDTRKPAQSGLSAQIEQWRKEAGAGDIVARNNLVSMLIDFGLLDEAIKEYEVICKEEHDRINIYHQMIELYNLTGNSNGLRTKYLELGQLYKENNIYDSALDIYQRLIALDSEDVIARENMAEILLTQDKKRESIYQYISVANIYSSKGQIKEVVDIYQKMLKIEPEGLLTHTKLADTYAQLGMNDKAIQEYLLIAEMYLDKKLYNNAIESYEAITRLAPEHLDAHVKLSQLYMKSGMSSKAIEENLVIADIYINQGKYDQAMEMAQNVIGAEPTHITAREKLIEVYRRKDLGEKAIAECQNLSEIFLKKNDLDKAIELYEKILQIEQKNYDVHYKLAELYEKKGFSSKAMQEYISMADIYSNDGDYSKAIEAYHKVLSLDQNNLEARYQLGVLLADKNNDLEGALQEFELIRRLSPTHIDALQRLTAGYIKLGKLQQAIQVSKDLKNKEILGDIVDRYKIAIDKNPDDFEARYNLGIIYKEFGDLENAIEQFQSLVKCPEKLLDAYNMLGLCFEQMGMGNLAINQFKKGLSSEGYKDIDYQELRYNLGLLYERRGMIREALAMYEEIFGVDIKYRDVTQRIQHLEEQLKSGG
ncbi:MAG: tetratricopeptide repeat protein [Candidatus Eremiobacterota bacterium]